MSLERYLSIKIIQWKTVYFPYERATLLSFLMFLFFVLLHLNVLFTFGYEYTSNNLTIVQCYSTNGSSNQWMTVWGNVNI